ncbi:MAG: polysaccharide biosynthesis C-terminal domain-containing protein, partial [Pseudomonadota bacterium]
MFAHITYYAETCPLDAILIPQIALLGAVIATLLSYALGLAVLATRGHRLIALPMPLIDLVKVSLAAASMAPVIWLMPALGAWPELFLKMIAGGTIYAAMAFLLDAGG